MITSVLPTIIFEDENLFIVNKPPGYYSHPNHAEHRVASLVDYFSDKMMEFHQHQGNPEEQTATVASNEEATHQKTEMLSELRMGLVHRLDRDTSGLVIMAKNKKTLSSLQDLFKKRIIKKKYQALVAGHLFEHDKHLIHQLTRDRYHRTRRKVLHEQPQDLEDHSSQPTNAKTAETKINPIAFYQNQTLVDIEILTGRTHQIRVQLSHIGHPIIGDTIYGNRGTSAPSDLTTPILLCAYSLEFSHPISKKILNITIDLPDFFKQYLNHCKGFQLH